jgi:hypothetical protein
VSLMCPFWVTEGAAATPHHRRPATCPEQPPRRRVLPSARLACRWRGVDREERVQPGAQARRPFLRFGHLAPEVDAGVWGGKRRAARCKSTVCGRSAMVRRSRATIQRAHDLDGTKATGVIARCVGEHNHESSFLHVRIRFPSLFRLVLLIFGFTATLTSGALAQWSTTDLISGKPIPSGTTNNHVAWQIGNYFSDDLQIYGLICTPPASIAGHGLKQVGTYLATWAARHRALPRQ